MLLIRICSTDEVEENSLRRFVIDGQEILVVKIGGEVFALSERCTHRGGPLSEGTLENGLITCPWHFGQFDPKTGHVEGPPPSEPLHKYDARVEDGVLYLSSI